MTGEPHIEDVEVLTHESARHSTWMVLRIRDSRGLTGLGECSDSGDPAVLAEALHAVQMMLPGSDAAGLLGWLRDRRAGEGGRRALAWSTVLGGVESALADLAARRAGVPLGEYLGAPAPAKVRLYANLNRAWGTLGPAAVAEAAVAAAAQGFTAVKIAPFPGGEDGSAGAVEGLKTIDAVREVLPPDVKLMVDCHFKLDEGGLRVLLPELAARAVHWIEDIVDPRDVDRLRRLRDEWSVPLAGGEHEWDPAVVAAACATGAYAYWLIDPKHAGGPRATQRLIGLTAGTRVTFHNPSGPVGTAHAAQLAGMTDRFGWLEYAWGTADRAGYLRAPELIDAGSLCTPGGPGIGVDLAGEPR
jgi:galactonate dehydratase